jgi:hypothetical protein
MERPVDKGNYDYEEWMDYIKDLEKYCNYLEGKSTVIVKRVPPKCSISEHEYKDALYASIYNPGTFYCSTCAAYIIEEYGMHKLRNLQESDYEKT